MAHSQADNAATQWQTNTDTEDQTTQRRDDAGSGVGVWWQFKKEDVRDGGVKRRLTLLVVLIKFDLGCSASLGRLLLVIVLSVTGRMRQEIMCKTMA